MRRVHRSALVPHSAAQMFDLVNDVEAYPEFLPWCRQSRVLDSSDNQMRAEVGMSLAGISRSFTTRNTLQRPDRIMLHLVDGPFRHLEGEWQFIALREDACRVTLDLTFEVSNRLFSMALTPAFEKVGNSLVDAFSRRADALYGRG